MSNLRSIVEKTMHVELEHFTHFRHPMALLVALVIFSSLPIVARTSWASVSALPTIAWKTAMNSGTSIGVPLPRSISNVLGRALNTACLHMRFRVRVPVQWQRGLRRLGNDDTYATPHAEAKYWRVAGRYHRRLYSGDSATSVASKISTSSRDGTVVPLVTYYTPRLLPLYRDRSGGGRRTSRKTDVDAQEGRIPPKTFCKWHRMVFQDSRHPTLAQAAMQMKYYSNCDLREIQRISRLLPDAHVFYPKRKGNRRAKATTKYGEMWQRWLASKGDDLVIVFE